MNILACKSIAIGILMLSGLLDASGQTGKFETRCGWLDNPTTATYSLSDKDREWVIGVQGGYQVEDFEIPAFKRGQWVSFFGGSYGFGCACLRATVDAETSRVVEIKKSYSRPLATCKKDKALRKWKGKF